MYVGNNNKPLVKLANYTDVSGLYVASGTYTVTANIPYSTYTEMSFNINASFNQSYQNVLFSLIIIYHLHMICNIILVDKRIMIILYVLIIITTKLQDIQYQEWLYQENIHNEIHLQASLR